MSWFAPSRAAAGVALIALIAAGAGCSGSRPTDDGPLATAAGEMPIRLDVEIGPTVDPSMATDSAEFVWPEDGGHPVRVSGLSTVTGRDVVSTRFSATNDGRAMLVLSLSDAAGDRLAAATTPPSERRAVVRWDGEVLYAPKIMGGPMRILGIVAERSQLETIADWLEQRSSTS